MNKLKKLVICAVTLCATVSAFGLKIDEHPASKKAQEQLVKDMLTRLNEKRVKNMTKLFKHLPHCDGNTYKKNRIPTLCVGDHVSEVREESSVDPGYFKPGTIKVATVDPTAAFKKAAEKYFALKKNPSYMDYNKMYTFYVQNKDTWAAKTLFDWASKETDYALTVFRIKVAYFRHELNENVYAIFYPKHYYYGKAYRWWEEAINVYNDKEAYYQTKWAIFSGVMFTYYKKSEHYNLYELVYRIIDSSFWHAFAIAPIYKDPKVGAQQAKKIRDIVKEAYQACPKLMGRWDDWNCDDIRILAQKYGYWDDPNELAAKKKAAKKRESEVYISTHLRR